MTSGAVVLDDADPVRLLAALRTAVRDGPTTAVVDHRWPAGLRAQVGDVVRRAAATGRAEPGDLVLFTSGSSGAPRGVVRTPASWDASVGPLSEVTGIGGQDVVWLPGPPAATLHLYGAWHALAVGAPLVAPGTADPAAAAEATAVHCVPAVLARLIEAARGGALPRLRTVVVAGARLDPALRAAAESLGWRVVEYYGAAELSFVGLGRGDGSFGAFPGAEVRVDGGALWVRSPYTCRGYADDAPGPLRRDAEGWCSVGDLAAARSDGGWELLGRGEAAVTTGGHTVVVEEVEAVLRRVPGVVDVAVLGEPHPTLGEVVVALVVGTAPRSALLEAVAGLPAPARPRRWRAVDALPTTGAGKVARARLRDDLAAGTLAARPLR